MIPLKEIDQIIRERFSNNGWRFLDNFSPPKDKFLTVSFWDGECFYLGYYDNNKWLHQNFPYGLSEIKNVIAFNNFIPNLDVSWKQMAIQSIYTKLHP